MGTETNRGRGGRVEGLDMIAVVLDSVQLLGIGLLAFVAGYIVSDVLR